MLDAQGPSADRARLLAAHARSALNCDRDDDARVTAERAVAEARALGVPDAEADALTTLAVLEVENPDRAGELFSRSLALARESGDLLAELRSIHNLASNRYYAGEMTKAEADLRGGHRTVAGHRCAVDGVRRRVAHLPRADPLCHRGSHAGAAGRGLGPGVGHLDPVGGRPVRGGRPGRRRRHRARARSVKAGWHRDPDDGAGLRRLHHRRADLGRRAAGSGRPDPAGDRLPGQRLERLLPRRNLAVRTGSRRAGRSGRADPAGRRRSRARMWRSARPCSSGPSRPPAAAGPAVATLGPEGRGLDGQGAGRTRPADRRRRPATAGGRPSPSSA